MLALKSIVLKLVIFISLCSPSSSKAQRILDYFEPDNLRLARLSWDESIDQKTSDWLQACLDTAHHSIKIWALHVMGVHLEQVPLIIDREQSKFQNFQHQIISILNTAKCSNNIDSTLIGFIDTTVFSSHNSHRATISHFLFDIVAIRFIKQTRKFGDEKVDLGIKLFVKNYGGHQKLLLELASKSKEEILGKAYSLFNAKDSSKSNRAALGWALISYRGRFLNEFEQYYQHSKFNHLSDEGQSILLQYWSFNLDLIDEEEKAQIFQLLKLKNSRKEATVIQLFKVMLRNLILNKTKNEHSNEIHELFHSEETEIYKEKIIQRLLAENRMHIDSLKQISTSKSIDIPAQPRVIRPESLVTIFEDCSEEELLEYLEENLKIELYLIPGAKKIQEVINIRAAFLLLGNMYYSENGIQAKQSRYDSLVNKLITIGTLDVDDSYGEATKLIYYLGNPAIPYFKTEFFNKDLKRADFATNKLIALKNLEVVNWMIRVIETNPDPMIKARALLALKIMNSYRDLQTANRGIAKEVSDQIARDVISPYLERNQ